MAKRITFIEIADRKYPLSFSLGVLKQITARCGSIEKIGDLFIGENGTMTEEHIGNITWMLATMMRSGAAYLNTFEADEPKVQGAALDKDGNYKALTEEDLELYLDMSDAESIIDTINKAMNTSQETDIDIEVEGDSKNE